MENHTPYIILWTYKLCIYSKTLERKHSVTSTLRYIFFWFFTKKIFWREKLLVKIKMALRPIPQFKEWFLRPFVFNYNIIPAYQSGFRCQHSTNIALMQPIKDLNSLLNISTSVSQISLLPPELNGIQQRNFLISSAASSWSDIYVNFNNLSKMN